jgi:hypothetical protein
MDAAKIRPLPHRERCAVYAQGEFINGVIRFCRLAIQQRLDSL